MRTKNHEPNSTLPDGATLLKKPRRAKIGAWAELPIDASVIRWGVEWYRVQGGMGERGDREDWIADIPGTTVSVHDYHWNGEEFGPNHGSFDNACFQELKGAISTIEHCILELRKKLSDKNAGLIALKKAVRA